MHVSLYLLVDLEPRFVRVGQEARNHQTLKTRCQEVRGDQEDLVHLANLAVPIDKHKYVKIITCFCKQKIDYNNKMLTQLLYDIKKSLMTI